MSASVVSPSQPRPRTSAWISKRPERLALIFAACLAGQAHAQATSCAIPRDIPTPRADGPSADQPVRRLLTASYTLALTWSPQYCREGKGNDSFQCDGTDRFGMMLHGLWPDGAGRQWPQYCAPTGIVPQRVVREMLCTTPSADLIQHEWAKHGTCGWTDPAVYFGKARALYQAIRMPDMLALSRRRDLTVGQFRALFARANPRIPATSINVRVTKDGWLDELWLCLDKNYHYMRCKAETGGKAASQRLQIWRGNLTAR